jgi:hypothetical protein
MMLTFLVWCFILIDDDSETLSGQPLGACHWKWQALSKARNNADGRSACGAGNDMALPQLGHS